MQIVHLQLLSPTTLITFSTELWLYQQYQREQDLPFHQNMRTKRLHHIILLFLFIDTKNWYLTNWDGTVTSRGPITQQILEKLHCLLSKIMNNKQVLIYGVLESTIDLRSIFVGHINLKKLLNFENWSKCFTVAWPGSGSRIRMFLYSVSAQEIFKIPRRISYCKMTRFKGTLMQIWISANTSAFIWK